MHRRILGFDLRVKPSGAAVRWDAQRRSVFLLRPETAWPKSVDRFAWPSFFDYSGSHAMELAPGAIEVRPDDFLHQVLDLWQKLDAMRHRAGAGIGASATTLRIDLLTLGPCADHAAWRFLSEGAEPDPKGESWQAIGYDAADASRFSGLSNCGFGEEQVAWRAAWAGRLNEHGLIADLEDAFAFCAATDKRVREHAPFFVYELHELADRSDAHPDA